MRIQFALAIFLANAAIASGAELEEVASFLTGKSLALVSRQSPAASS
jgi:hypothetical protein